MAKNSFKKIVVKVGTNVLSTAEGLLDEATFARLVSQIAFVKKQGIQLILVSSGAVGAGRMVLPAVHHLSKVVRRQMLSAVGQIQLMNLYTRLFADHCLHCAQVLATKEDFRDRSHYLNMKNCFQALLRDEIVPIVNENDVVAVSELMFTDNDELAGLIAAMTNADALIILTNVDGVFDGPPSHPDSRLIKTFTGEQLATAVKLSTEKSSFGRGGMHTKLRIAQKSAALGIATFIANGKRPEVLQNILDGQFNGTYFPPQQRLSNVKKWMAHQHSSSATVYINSGAAGALCAKERVSSLLPVGITRIEGDFKKGDIVEIFEEGNGSIGIGIAQYGAEKAQKNIGQQGKQALIHYDYLLISKDH